MTNQTPKQMLEQAYGRSFTDEEYMAMVRRLSEFFDILHEWQQEKEVNKNV